MQTQNAVAYLDALLDIANVPDYPNALNGLQFANLGTISKVAASVDFSQVVIDAAVREGANFLIVHHGMFWAGLKPFTAVAYSRVRSLVENDIAVYSAHLPLDRHPVFGNNVLLSRELGLAPSGEFAWHKGTSIGVCGDADVATKELIDRATAFATRHGGHVVATPASENHVTRKWAACSGAGASSETLAEANALGIDTLIVGEGPHHTAVEARELGITIIYAGHYATETLGVEALAKDLANKFNLAYTVIHAPTGL
jgi:dinuclear metal center YbgI/SA1388 family protein